MLLTSGCASLKARGKETSFKSYLGDRQFTSRVKHAETSNEGASELLKKGYIPIGSIRVTHDQDKAYGTDPTSRILIEAADRGGELMTLSANNTERVKTKRKRTKCREVRRKLVSVWDPYNALDTWQAVEVCVDWEYEIRKIRVVESAGIVWRAEPNTLQKHAASILFMAIEDNNSSLAGVLVQNGSVGANMTDAFGWTPLMSASFYGGGDNYELAELLIKQGARLDSVDNGGKTALMRAVINGNMDIAGLLIRSGADPGKLDNTGKSVLDHATDENRAVLENLLQEQ